MPRKRYDSFAATTLMIVRRELDAGDRNRRESSDEYELTNERRQMPNK